MISLGARLAFIREMFTDSHHTGSVYPSSRFLARALSKRVAESPARNGSRTILEGGSGTGPVTRQLIMMMNPGDRLFAFELNERMAEVLEREVGPLAAKHQVELQVLCQPVQEVDRSVQFDEIVSCLPFNNFHPSLVEEILDVYFAVLAPGGSLSFFEYLAMRHVKTMVSFGAKRKRLKEIAAVFNARFEAHSCESQNVMLNIPPATVHRLEAQAD